MKTAILLIAEGFEEIEAVTIADILRRGGVNVTMAGLTALDVTGAHNITIKTDSLLEDVKNKLFDAIILPGGMVGTENLLASETTKTMLQGHANAGKLVTAICAAPWVLAEAEILNGKKATIYPSLEPKIGGKAASGTVVQDGLIITSQGPATAMEFALTLVEQLAGETTRKEVSGGLLYSGS